MLIDDTAVALAVMAKMALPADGFKFISIEVPIAARFPLKTTPTDGPGDWYIHLGADGYLGQGRELGPVRAQVLPGLLDQSADAFLMVRGGSLLDFPSGSGRTSQGPLTALGFGFHFTIGIPRVVWAEIMARAEFLLTMSPVAFIGKGTIGGKLRIGFFSIGIDARIDFVYIPLKEPWVKAEICGTVDLFFDEIHECVTLSYNDQGALDPPAPTSPLEHEQGHWLVDDHYQRLSEDPSQPSRLTQDAASAPTVWPDAIPLIVFATAPALAVVDTTFKDINTYPTGIAAKSLGNERLKYDWTLTSVKLVDETDNKELTGPFSCAWQLGKFGNSAEQAQPAELALFTLDDGIWMNALPDAGEGLHHEPGKWHADLCQVELPEAQPGWAIGANAQRIGDRWRLPPDPLSGNPLQSQVVVYVRVTVPDVNAPPVLHAARKTVTRPYVAMNFGPPFVYEEARLRTFPSTPVHGRAFSLALSPALIVVPVSSPRTDERWLDLDVSFEDTLTRPEAWLYVEKNDRLDLDAGVKFEAPWVVATNTAVAGGWILCIAGPDTSKGLVAHLTPGIRVAVIGVWGVTEAALTAQSHQKSAVADKVAKKANAPVTPPGNGTPANSGDVRCVLAHSHTYRIELALQWVVTWADPASPKTGSVTTSLYFKTAPPKRRTGIVAAKEFAYRNTKLAVFNPDMIERYLEAYEPAQSETTWFTGDAVRAHFRHSHVAALAGTYGYDLSCQARKLDDKAPAKSAVKEGPTYPRSSAYMKGPQKKIAEAILASNCGFKPPGLVWEATFALEPQAWYEVYVDGKPRPATPNLKGGRLRGVTFRTSRWPDPQAMLRDLCSTPGAGKSIVMGDAELSTFVTAPIQALNGDAAFDELLAGFGMEGWPPITVPRTSRLWTSVGGVFKCVGVLFESPEPIHRPNRVEVPANGLVVEVGGVSFNIHGRDRSGCRLLFATSTPFSPATNCALRLNARDVLANASIYGRLVMPTVPTFAA